MICNVTPRFRCINYDTTKILAILRNKINVDMSKPLYLGPLVLDISKIVKCEYWYDIVKPKYGKKAKLFYMDMGSFIVHVKSEDIYADLPGVVKKIFDTSNYEFKRPLPIRNKISA